MPAHNSLSKVNASCHFNAISFQEISYSGDYVMPLHTHEEAHLAFGLTGTTRGVWRKQNVIMNAFTLTFIPEEEPHASYFHDGVKVFLITLPLSWIERIRQYSAILDRPAIYQNDRPAWLAMRLYHEFQSQDNLTPLMLETLTLELLVGISREVAYYGEKKAPRWLQQTKDFLHVHFRECLSIDAVAAAVDIHPAHLTRAFHQQFHCTIGAYVRKRRIEYACHLLSASELSLSQIALEIGFADQSHFSRTFKSLTGMTPAEFQKISGRADLKQKMLP